MLAYSISSATGWVLMVLLIATIMYPFLLRSGLPGPVQPFLKRMRIHYLLGYSIAGIVLVHLWVLMSSGLAGRVNAAGLYLATVALLLIFVQVSLGRRLSWPKLSMRRIVRRWHFWVMMGIVVFVLGHIALNLANLYDNTIQQRLPAVADSQVASRLLLQAFPGSRGTPAILVFYDAGGLNVADRIRIKQINDWLTSEQKSAAVGQVDSVFTVPQAIGQLISQDGTTMTMIATINGQATGQSVKAIRLSLQNVTAASPLQAYLTGPAGIVNDVTSFFGSVDVTLLLTTIGFVFLLLIILYRSPILALLPLIGVGIALQVANALLGFGARAGLFSVSQMSSSIATVLLFGAGTDYSMFIASRFREELAHTKEKHLAMQHTMRAIGEAITSSAAIVILALLTLLFRCLFLLLPAHSGAGWLQLCHSPLYFHLSRRARRGLHHFPDVACARGGAEARTGRRRSLCRLAHGRCHHLCRADPGGHVPGLDHTPLTILYQLGICKRGRRGEEPVI